MIYYSGNDIDNTTVEQYAKTIINKIVKQLIDSKVFGDIFSIFDKKLIDGAGYQVEELEVGNITGKDFDPTGANALKKADMNIKALYHKINRKKTYKATVQKKTIRTAMLSRENTAQVCDAIINELYNSSAIEDYEAMKQLFHDILETKKIVLCDMNSLGGNMDNLTKAVQILAENMTKPSTKYNFLGFKKEFNKKEDLVLVMDSITNARMNVESLANAFHIDKKQLVDNIIVLDEMPEFKFTAEATNKQIDIKIGEHKNETGDIIDENITIGKPAKAGETAMTGKPICLLLNRKAIIRDKIERDLDTDKNGEGRFINYSLYAEDLLSYSPLRNAVAIID